MAAEASSRPPSGGCFISMASRRIVAEPSTITGSIGVFGLTLNMQKIANDHGITFDAVKTGVGRSGHDITAHFT